MDTADRPHRIVDLESPFLASGLDEDSFAFFSSLIEQNAELMQKVQELKSLQGLADSSVSEAHKQAESIRNRIEAEANARAAPIISEAETKAKLQANRILAEAAKEAEATKLWREKEANDRAATIVNEAETRAKLQANRIMAEAQKTCDNIIKERTQTAMQQGLLIIEKAREKALSILEEADSRAKAIPGKSNQKVKR
jgi:vacuolar-type H+-ATPase subunit H